MTFRADSILIGQDGLFGQGYAALICVNAHNIIEVKPPEEMARIVDEMIASRVDRETEAA